MFYSFWTHLIQWGSQYQWTVCFTSWWYFLQKVTNTEDSKRCLQTISEHTAIVTVKPKMVVVFKTIIHKSVGDDTVATFTARGSGSQAEFDLIFFLDSWGQLMDCPSHVQLKGHFHFSRGTLSSSSLHKVRVKSQSQIYLYSTLHVQNNSKFFT